MRKANRLTGRGDLLAATQAIQSALGLSGALPQRAQQPRQPSFRSAAADDGNVIDIDAVAGASPGPRDGAPVASGRFVGGSHTSAQGHREYKLFVPSQAAAATGPLPLVVMLHGCTQTADDFAAGTAMNALAGDQGFYVLYPQQTTQANPQRCWNWFKHNHQERGRGEPALLAGMVSAVMSEHTIDPARVWVAGLSAGGAMAAILAQAYPEIFAAAGVHSGLAAGAAEDLGSAMAAMRQGASGSPSAFASTVPTIVFHGDADATVHPVNGTQAFEAASAPGAAASAATRMKQSGRRQATRRISHAADGRVQAEHWLVHGAPHAWSGGSAAGSYTDPRGPDATAEMLRFFLEHPRMP